MIARKDCVIIPGVGAILASYESARIDRSTSILLPPKRVYTFNKDINHNDGILACSIARAESIRYELACKKMESEIESMLHTLHSVGEITIGNIGALRYSKQDDTIQFDPTAINASAAPDMLLPILKLGTKITFVTPEKARVRIAKSPITKKHESIFRRITRLTASIALVAGICFLATLLPSNHNDEAMKASLAPEFIGNDSEGLEETWETLSITSSNKYKQYSEIDAASTTFSNQNTHETNGISGVDGPRFYIIVAAVRSSEEAGRFISQHSGEELKSMSYKNLYVVYSSESSDKDEAFNLCCKAVKKYPGAWICTK